MEKKKGGGLRGMLYRRIRKKEPVKPKTRTAAVIHAMKGAETPFTKFHIAYPSKMIFIPTPRLTKTKAITYNLMSPYSYANIKYDAEENELVYSVIEPDLTEYEKYILEKIKEGLIQTINVNLEDIKKKEKIIDFLESSVQRLLYNYGFDVNDKEYLKIMYYVFRDFVGLDEIEPLLADPFIEDIGCDGVDVPVYIVHQKFGSMKTSIIFNDEPKLREFVTKLAERCDRYISYAEPLLDGSLPDGTRVQASLARDVTTRGPTFSIRKFREVPLTPVDMIRLKTTSPEMLAYLWFIVEHGSNILISGGVSTGKTSFLNSISLFIPGESKIVSIEDSVTGDCEIIAKINKKIKVIKISELVDAMIKKYKIDSNHGKNSDGIEILCMNGNYQIEFAKPSSFIRHKVKKDIYEITTATGRKIKITEDHSLFGLNDAGDVVPVSPKEIDKHKFIAVPRFLPIEHEDKKEINLLEYLPKFDKEFITGEPVRKIFEKISYKKFSQIGIGKSKYAWWKRKNIISTKIFRKIIHKMNFEIKDIKKLIMMNQHGGVSLPVLIPVSDEMLAFFGLWLGDGSYDIRNKNRVIVTNVDKECIDLVRKFADSLGINISIMSDKASMSVNSTMLYKLMKAIGFDGHAHDKRVPEFVHNLSNRQIASLLRGYFSADGSVKNFEVSCSSQSLDLLNDIQTLLLRFGIISRISHYERKDKCRELIVSSNENITRFRNIGFLQDRKNNKIEFLISKKSHHAVSDIIPLGNELIAEINKFEKLSWPYRHGMQNIGRGFLQRISNDEDCDSEIIRHLANSHIFWDKVKKIIKLPKYSMYVYDISVPGNENFVCSNIVAHNTRELNLPHENWIPGVARSGFTGANVGEVSMFELLRESFRQNPDYLIVGEIRGKEAYVMFQGMASGHPSLSTIHAGNVDDLMKRLQTKPISLSPGLLESLDAVIVMSHAREKGKSARRIKEIDEIESIDSNTGVPRIVKSFVWQPQEDTYEYRGNSWILNKISREKGMTFNNIIKDISARRKLLEWLYDNNVTGLNEVTNYIRLYMTNPEKIDEIMKGKDHLREEYIKEVPK